MNTRPYYFDDLDAGQRITTGSHTMTAEEIIVFAREYDPQPFHTDPEAAKNSLFGGLVASGWHTAAISMRLLVNEGHILAGGVIGKGGELQWLQPVRPGDVLTVECEIVELTASAKNPQRGTVSVRMLTHNQRGEVVQDATARLVVPRR